MTVGKGPPQTQRKPERGASAPALVLPAAQAAAPRTRHGLRCVYARVCEAPQDATDMVNSFNNSY